MLNVTEFEVKGDGVAIETAAIQAVIDQCAEAGGGTVYFPAGTYKTGTLFLRNNITMHLESGATILGSETLSDYNPELACFIDAVGDKRGRCLIYAGDLQNVRIEGMGTIDGNGAAFEQGKDLFSERPFLVRFHQSRNISMSGVTLRDSAAWVSHYLDCQDVAVNNVSISSRVNLNNDGIDIDSCVNVRISDCNIDTGDDAICIKTTLSKPSRNITVNNCTITSDCAALKIGTESAGDFKNIVVSNCVIYDTNHGGIKIFTVDGAELENVIISNLVMDNVMGPIMLRLGERLRTYHENQEAGTIGYLRNVLISNIVTTVPENQKCPAAICVSGIPGHYIEDVTIENVKAVFPGGCCQQPESLEVPEKIEAYPTFNMFGDLPASALYMRHVKEITFRNVKLDLAAPDARATVVCDDVQQPVFDNCRVATSTGKADIIMQHAGEYDFSQLDCRVESC